MTDLENKALTDVNNIDIVEILEFIGIKLHAYQRVLLRMMYNFQPKKKGDDI